MAGNVSIEVLCQFFSSTVSICISLFRNQFKFTVFSYRTMQYRESQSESFPRFQHPSTGCVYESQDHPAGRSRKESEKSESSYLLSHYRNDFFSKLIVKLDYQMNRIFFRQQRCSAWRQGSSRLASSKHS